MTTPFEGVEHTGSTSTESAVSAFLDRWKDAEEPSDTGEGANTEIEDQDDEDELLDEADATGDPEDDDDLGDDNNEGDEDRPEATDDHKVTVTVDGETKTVTVKELKRLFGQEASLTRKSQEVAAARKAAEADAERYAAATQRLLTKAEERFKPFENIDWLVAQQRLNPDEFAALRAEAREAYSELEFIKQESAEFLTQLQMQKQQERQAQAQETIAVLEKQIPGWNETLYNKVRDFTVKGGMPVDMFNNIVDAPSLKFFYEAMRYAEVKEKARTKKASQRTAPKRVLKPSDRNSKNFGKPEDKSASAFKNLKQTGKRDAAVEAFMARWVDSDD